LDLLRTADALWGDIILVPSVGFESKPQCQEYNFVAHEKIGNLHENAPTLAKEAFVSHDRIHDTALADTYDPLKKEPPRIC
jgi:hypothetical protein